MRQLAREAKDRPGDREAFRQLHLNIWLDHSASPFVDMGIYDEGASPVDLQALAGEPCWLGVDLSSTSDLTAVASTLREIVAAPNMAILHPVQAVRISRRGLDVILATP